MLRDENSLLRLMTLFSPVFPIGGFAYSHGLEQAIHEGFITSANELFNWLSDLLCHGSGHNDAIFIAETWKRAKNGENLQPVIDIANAIPASKERNMETQLQGNAFCRAVGQMGFADQTYKELPYPVAVGFFTQKMGLQLSVVLNAYLHGFSSNLVQAAIRLVPLGQSDGVCVMGKMEEIILAIVSNSDRLTIDCLGSCCFMSDIMAMRHETLYSRIFRS